VGARKAVFGLGNPGARYAATRHNVGARAVQRAASDAGMRTQPDVLGFSELFEWKRQLFVLPQTYMNRSGAAVAEAVAHFGLLPERCLVVFDDLDLALGQLRVRAGGGSGGQRGMQSVIDALGTEAIPRLRIGIGRPLGPTASDHVLAPFDDGEQDLLERVLARASQAALAFASEDLERVMNRFNGPVS
jgi:PTH1 family peptidyl-tRNA hydrolase